MTQNLKFDLVAKDRLFYNQYAYSVGFDLAEAAVLKRLDHAAIRQGIERRRAWREHALQRHASTKSTFPWPLGDRLREITQETEANLHTVCDLLLDTVHAYKLVTTGNTAWVYTNSLDLINELDQLDILANKSYTQALINRPADTIILKNSPHTARSYFRAVKLDVKDSQNLRSFLNLHKENIRISPALLAWLEDSKYRMADYFFIDYSGETWLTMLSLVRPGLIRKTIKIIPDK